MNKRPLGEKKIFFLNVRPPLALSQTIAPYLLLCQSCLPSFRVQTSWRQRNPLGALLPGGTCASALAGGQQKWRPGPGSARPRPRRAGAPQPAERGAPAGQARDSRRGLPRTRVESAAPGPRSRPLSPGVIKSEILLPVTPVLLARADLHMKGLRRAWAFSFSHSQWGAAYK